MSEQSRPLMNTPADTTPDMTVMMDGHEVEAHRGEILLDALNRYAAKHGQKQVPQVCYVPAMGNIQSCDTCMVEVNGQLVRGCGTRVEPGMTVVTMGHRVDVAQREAFDRILQNHELYCTVCDNNNQNCVVHNTTGDLDVKHQARPYAPKPYEKDMSNPFYRYDPDQCILCGRCVEACQNVQVNETLTIDWKSEHPRVLWDGGEKIEGSSCVSCGHCVTVCPCNALMEKSMLGKAGYLTNIPEKVLANDHSQLDAKFIAKAVDNHVRQAPDLPVTMVRMVVADKFGYDVTWRQVYEGKKKAVVNLFGY